MRYTSPKPIGARKSVIEDFAQKAAQKLGYEAGGDIAATVKKLGGRIASGSTGHEDVESGSIVIRSMRDFTIYLSPITSLERDRFTIAHELGHLLVHYPVILKSDADAVMRATRYVDAKDPVQQRAEWEANWFAAAFIMPEQEFRVTYPQGNAALQQKFGVSNAAVDARIKSLKL